mmetsp:Transcript_56296/g.112882  ORF Transcript_56296/g.112882 Transcript_56296/m.112882 type:complete len:212 (-) Transcript_56296:77-712(-)
MTAHRPVHSRLPATLLLCAGALGFLLFGGNSGTFTGAPVGLQYQRGDRVALRSKETAQAGRNRRRKVSDFFTYKVRVHERRKVLKFAEVVMDYKNGEPFSPAQAANGEETTVKFERWPSGILRYFPGKDWKGAMVKEVSKPYYVGDPSGQAHAGGVKSGMVVKSINGENVLMSPFEDIMEALASEHYATSVQKWPRIKLPMNITFAEVSAR